MSEGMPQPKKRAIEVGPDPDAISAALERLREEERIRGLSPEFGSPELRDTVHDVIERNQDRD